METITTDVAIIGAGGAGLRAAIALAQADPKLRVALISKVYPMRSHTCAAEGGAAGVIKSDDSLEQHFSDTVGGGDWLCDQDAVDILVQEAPKKTFTAEERAACSLEAMLNGGELDGVRLLSPVTLDLMMDNHTGDLPLWLPGPGMGFGLGWAVIEDRGEAATPLSEGSVYWGGAYATLSWIDREEELIGVLMTQVRPYNHINIRQDFQVLVHQAIID